MRSSGRLVACGGMNGDIILKDFRTMNTEHTIDAHPGMNMASRSPPRRYWCFSLSTFLVVMSSDQHLCFKGHDAEFIWTQPTSWRCVRLFQEKFLHWISRAICLSRVALRNGWVVSIVNLLSRLVLQILNWKLTSKLEFGKLTRIIINSWYPILYQSAISFAKLQRFSWLHSGFWYSPASSPSFTYPVCSWCDYIAFSTEVLQSSFGHFNKWCNTSHRCSRRWSRFSILSGETFLHSIQVWCRSPLFCLGILSNQISEAQKWHIDSERLVYFGIRSVGSNERAFSCSLVHGRVWDVCAIPGPGYFLLRFFHRLGWDFLLCLSRGCCFRWTVRRTLC